MAFIGPIHRNKPDIIYLITYLPKQMMRQAANME